MSSGEYHGANAIFVGFARDVELVSSHKKCCGCLGFFDRCFCGGFFSHCFVVDSVIFADRLLVVAVPQYDQQHELLWDLHRCSFFKQFIL